MRKPFLPVGLNLDGRRCVVIGAADDREAIEKTALLQESGADVKRIEEYATLRACDLDGAFLVISTPQDAQLSATLRELADMRGFLLCCIDQPEYGFVAMMALATAGPVRIAISTTGLAPKVGKTIKTALQRAMDERFQDFVTRLGARREATRAAHPEPEASALRRADALEAAREFDADVTFRYESGRPEQSPAAATQPKGGGAGIELVAVGTELLLGQLQDTNTAYIASRLAKAGIDVFGTHAVGDNRPRIAALLRDVLSRRDGAIVTGGLGPTIDDLTKEAVCDALDLGVELYEPALSQMRAFFASAGREMPANNRKQAELPRGSVPLPNPNGTAPGFIALSKDGRFVACMPGVPSEMRPMLDDALVPWLVHRYGSRAAIYTRVIHTAGIGESDVDRRIDDLFRAGVNPKIAVLAHDGRVDVKLMAKAGSEEEALAAIEPLERDVAERLRGFVYGRDATTLAAAIHELLQRTGKTVAVAESCTGGRIAAALTAVPGSSQSFCGGIVAYDNAVKIAAVGVDEALIGKDGAVSERVAAAMARGVRERLGAAIAIATTGIAGPSGGTAEKPVGLVWFAIDAADGRSRTWRRVFPGDRETVQRRATTLALGELWRYVRG